MQTCFQKKEQIQGAVLRTAMEVLRVSPNSYSGSEHASQEDSDSLPSRRAKVRQKPLLQKNKKKLQLTYDFSNTLQYSTQHPMCALVAG